MAYRAAVTPEIDGVLSDEEWRNALWTNLFTDITRAVTSINTEKLPSGIYVWKVINDGSEAESGKWVKE